MLDFFAQFTLAELPVADDVVLRVRHAGVRVRLSYSCTAIPARTPPGTGSLRCS
jgi:hypothetical protein